MYEWSILDTLKRVDKLVLTDVGTRSVSLTAALQVDKGR